MYNQLLMGDEAFNEEDKQTLVIAIGGLTLQAGFAGEDEAHAIFPSVVGHSIGRGGGGLTQQDLYIGDAAYAKRGVLKLQHPIESGGAVADWDNMEKILHYAFYVKLGCAPEEHNGVVITDSPKSSPEQREKLCQILFDSFKVPKLYITTKPLLALYASGRATGVSVHLTGSGAVAAPVCEHLGIGEAVRTSHIGGHELTECLRQLLTERGLRFSEHASEGGFVNELKERLAYVALDLDAEMQSSALEKPHELPNGEVITIGNERFRCTEPLFSPALVGSSAPGLAWLVADSIRACNVDTQAALWGHVVLSGGSSLFPGLSDRLHKELTAIAPASTRVNVIAPPEREFSAWIGGSIIGSLNVFESRAISRAEYEAVGPPIVHRKCGDGGYMTPGSCSTC